MSLIDKAKSVRGFHGDRAPVPLEQLELALAYARREVTARGVILALGNEDMKSHSVAQWASYTFLKAAQDGMIEIRNGNACSAHDNGDGSGANSLQQ